MNFPDEPFFRSIFWIINTPGIGGIVASLIGVGAITLYSLAVRWVINGGNADEAEVYTFPTATLLHHGENHPEYIRSTLGKS